MTVSYTHLDVYKRQGLYRTLMVPRNLVWKIFVKGTPLLLNEALWACGVAVLAQCYSIRGLNVVAAQNISNRCV